MKFKEFFYEGALPDLKVGDIIKVGKFKNKPVEITGFGEDDNGQPTVLTKALSGRGKGKERKAFPFRVFKLMPGYTKEKEEELKAK